MSLSECLTARLRDPSLLSVTGFADMSGKCAGEGQFDVVNPANGEILACLPEMGARQTSAAIDRAYDAQKNWAACTVKERSAVMRSFNDLIVENIEDLATHPDHGDGQTAC